MTCPVPIKYDAKGRAGEPCGREATRGSVCGLHDQAQIADKVARVLETRERRLRAVVRRVLAERRSA